MSSVRALTLLHRDIYGNNPRSHARMIHIMIFFFSNEADSFCLSEKSLSLRENRELENDEMGGCNQSKVGPASAAVGSIQNKSFSFWKLFKKRRNTVRVSHCLRAHHLPVDCVSQDECSGHCSVLDTAVCNFTLQVHISLYYPTTFYELQFKVFVCKHPIAATFLRRK